MAGGALTAVVIGGAIPASASAVVKTIPVGTSPEAISSDGTHVWVANSADGTVTEIDASTGDVVGSPISVGSGPIGVSSDGTHVWVANSGGAVTELNASTGAFIQNIVVGLAPGGISSDGTHVWVTGSSSATSTVTELNASTGVIIQTIPDGAAPTPITSGVSSDGTHVWVTNFYGTAPMGESGNTVSELNASTGSLIQTIAVGANPRAVSSDGTHVWVANTSGTTGTVSELNASTGSVIQTIGVGSDPSGVSSDGNHVWVANTSSNTVTELNASTGAFIQNIANPAGSGDPFGVSSDGTHVWVANDLQADANVSEIGISPTTSVLIPSNGATLSGTAATLDASASNATSVQFLLFGGTYGLSGHPVGTATSSPYGWIDIWDTTTVPNGSYTLVSVASGPGGSAASAGVSMTVNNSPPTTNVLIPSNGATVSGTGTVLDASASNATSVQFVLFGGTYGLSGHLLGTATSSAYGWIDIWDTTSVPNGSYVLVSVASGPGGTTASSGIGLTVNN